jgi:FtsH-binding integral membrane protein
MENTGSKAIWDKPGSDSISSRAYAAALGVSLSWAVFLVAIGARISYNWSYGLGLVLFTFILSIAGIVIFTHSEHPTISLIGVSTLSFFMGLSIGPVVAYYNADVVVDALLLTVLVTIGMGILGILLPEVIGRFAGVLFVGLLVLLVGYFSTAILSLFGINSNAVNGVLDWLSLAVFSLYIWYDWGRAMKLPKTLDNAIDVSGALIVDIVNLFLTMLRLVSRSRQ